MSTEWEKWLTDEVARLRDENDELPCRVEELEAELEDFRPAQPVRTARPLPKVLPERLPISFGDIEP